MLVLHIQKQTAISVLDANGTGVVQINDLLEVTGRTDITAGGLNVDAISSYTADTNLTLSGDGTGIVYVNDNPTVNGQIDATTA